MSEHHWISDVCHDWDKTRYRLCFEQTLEVCIKTWQESSYCCKRVLRYLQFSKDYHLDFSRGKATEKLSLHGYCDASWGCQVDGSSVPGFVFKVLTGPVSWCAKKQSTIALSTAELTFLCLMLFRKQFC